MKLKTLTLLIVFCLSFIISFSQVWSSLGTTPNRLNANAPIQTTYCDLSGNIYAAGNFGNSVNYPYVAKWDGTKWKELGTTPKFLNGNIFSICGDPLGNIYAAGYITDASYNLIVAKFDGTNWSKLGTNIIPQTNSYYITSICSDTSGNIYAAGEFKNANGNYYVAEWNKKTNLWTEAGGLNALSLNGKVDVICCDAAGKIYVGGDFYHNNLGCYVNKWDGTKWNEVGSFNFGQIYTLYPDKLGNLYAGGNNMNDSGKFFIAKWDGTKWSELGGVNSLKANMYIHTICGDNSGNIYTAGEFTNGLTSNLGKYYVAQWDGTKWNELGGKNGLAANNMISSICSDALWNIYAGGSFTNDSSKQYVAKFSMQSANSVVGRVISQSNKAIKNVIINYSGTKAGFIQSDTTGTFKVGLLNGNYTITPTKNNDINKTNGVTTLDLALVQSHVLGKNKLNNPYKIIAADVNGDGKITTLDLVYMKRLILGIDTTFSNSTTKENRLWAFVDSSYSFPDTTNPFPFKDSISYTGLSANKTNQTFIGVKLGDVNWDWNPALAKMPSKVFVRPKKVIVGE